MAESVDKLELRRQRLTAKLDRIKAKLAGELKPEKRALYESMSADLADHLHLLDTAAVAAPEGLVIEPPTGGIGITSPT